MAASFTREEFYDLVWSKPMTHLAKQFAISDVALHKMCRKQNIPTPPLGWWAKKAAGKKVTQTPLPKLQEGASGKITIAGADLAVNPRLSHKRGRRPGSSRPQPAVKVRRNRIG